ncbi:MAG: Gfo/Idh/MocA family oxidoreductase [Verrucomicrobiales bacterium]|nr:Gfo/Idh/MocA family oxidoreductase [Verrucomicrobiales bacterium]
MNANHHSNITAVPALGRRRFLQTGAAAAGAISILPSATVRAFNANSKIRLGIIGCGGRGQWIAKLFRENGSYEIAGAADFFADHAEALQLAQDRVFTGLKCGEKMIAKGGLDAVAVISPPFFHPSQTRAAVDAGLHVYLAKPMAVDVPGCQEIQAAGEAARKKNLTLLIDFQTRATDFFIEAMKRVHAGALGDLCFGEAMYHGGRLGKQAEEGTKEAMIRNWVFHKSLSGDVMTEQFIHAIDVMNWAMNNAVPLRVDGSCGRKVRKDVGDCNDCFSLLFTYPNDVSITFTGRQYNGHGTREGIINRMFGSKGTLETEYGGDVLIRTGDANAYRGGKTPGIYKDGVVVNIRTFADSIKSGNASNPTLESSVLSNLLTIFGRTAAYQKQPLAWADFMKSTDRMTPDLTGLPE